MMVIDRVNIDRIFDNVRDVGDDVVCKVELLHQIKSHQCKKHTDNKF